MSRPRWKPTTSLAELRERVQPIVDRVESYGIDELTAVVKLVVDHIFSSRLPDPHGALRVLVSVIKSYGAFDLDAEELRCAIDGDDEDFECDSFARKFEGE